MIFKDFMDMYTNWNGIVTVNDDDLNLIVSGKIVDVIEKYPVLHDYEVVSFGFYSEDSKAAYELTVRIKGKIAKITTDCYISIAMIHKDGYVWKTSANTINEAMQIIEDEAINLLDDLSENDINNVFTMDWNICGEDESKLFSMSGTVNKNGVIKKDSFHITDKIKID